MRTRTRRCARRPPRSSSAWTRRRRRKDLRRGTCGASCRDSECARLNVHFDAQLDVCTGLCNAFQHLLEVVSADADKDPKTREEAAVFFKYMEYDEEDGLTVCVHRTSRRVLSALLRPPLPVCIRAEEKLTLVVPVSIPSAASPCPISSSSLHHVSEQVVVPSRKAGGRLSSVVVARAESRRSARTRVDG